jgi:hypothetical protein
MAYEKHLPKHQFPAIAASLILPYQTVRQAGTTSTFALPVATNSQEPWGPNGAATAGASGLNQREMITVYEPGNICKGVAAASLGANTDVEVGSTNGALQPAQMITASGHWRVGKSLTPAAAGEVFSYYVNPRKA